MLDRTTVQRCSIVVHQATGTVAVQAGCDVEAAFDLLVLHAQTAGRTLERTALDVLDHVVRFGS